ncbi:MAG: hypothetical protein O3C10_13435, partial [Chloroflexi bacterium]|nr:hypothetical protein [Chloroflexota bacterium]
MTTTRRNGHQRALLIALFAVGAALVLSVVSFANTSTSSTVTITTSGVAGEFGFSVGQAVPGASSWVANDATTVTVGSVANLAVGDYILIDEEGDADPDGDAGTAFSYHTITGIADPVLTVSPDIDNTYTGTASVTEEA